MEICSCCLVANLALDQEVVGELIDLDSSRHTGKMVKELDGHDSLICIGDASSRSDPSEGALVKKMLKSTNASLVRLERGTRGTTANS